MRREFCRRLLEARCKFPAGFLQERNAPRDRYGELQLVNNVNVMGGTLAGSGSQIHSIRSMLTNVTNNGGFVLSDGSQTTLNGTITNNGNVLFHGLGSHTYLFLGGDVTLAGSGTITLGNSGLDHIYSLSGLDTLDYWSRTKLSRAEGILGANQTNIVNNGTITGQSIYAASDWWQ